MTAMRIGPAGEAPVGADCALTTAASEAARRESTSRFIRGLLLTKAANSNNFLGETTDAANPAFPAAPELE